MAEKAQGTIKGVAGWPAAIKGYFQELQLEMRRVTWPTWPQVRATTGVVIACVLAFAAYFFVVDQVISRTIDRVYRTFTR
jgi:preprotein translocase subunit SecE